MAVATNVKVFRVMETIWYSRFRTSTVIAPPRLAAPLNVTKSPTLAPCPAAATVIVEDPLVAVNGSEARVTGATRSGVMSYATHAWIT